MTDKTVPRRLGPKRASKIRKLFNLTKEDDVRKYVIKRPLPLKEGQTKPKYKKPKIQRLVTPLTLQVSARLFYSPQRPFPVQYFLAVFGGINTRGISNSFLVLSVIFLINYRSV